MEILGEKNAPALDAIAWYGGNSGVDFHLEYGQDSSHWPGKQYPHKRAGTHPVGGKEPNPWGLFDMLGNVWEWTLDAWRDDYRDAPGDGTAWEGWDFNANADRVVRGGSWISNASRVRTASRLGYWPGIHDFNLGFRCARVHW